MTTNLKERFEEKFPRFQFSINESPWDKTERVSPVMIDNHSQIILAFIKQELELLADTIDLNDFESIEGEAAQTKIVAIIRNRAKELE